MGKVFIVAGGPSLSEFDFTRLRDYDTIVVNRAIENVPNPDYFITMDHTFITSKINMDVFTASKATKFFVANFASPHLKEINGNIYDTRFESPYSLGMFDEVLKSYAVCGIGITWDDFRNGDCSGYCALQLAVLLGYRRIYLMGVDLITSGTRTHYHKGYKSHPFARTQMLLDRYYNNFITAVDSIRGLSNVKLMSCSEISKLNKHIEYVDIESALRD